MKHRQLRMITIPGFLGSYHVAIASFESQSLASYSFMHANSCLCGGIWMPLALLHSINQAVNPTLTSVVCKLLEDAIQNVSDYG